MGFQTRADLKKKTLQNPNTFSDFQNSLWTLDFTLQGAQNDRVSICLQAEPLSDMLPNSTNIYAAPPQHPLTSQLLNELPWVSDVALTAAAHQDLRCAGGAAGVGWGWLSAQRPLLGQVWPYAATSCTCPRHHQHLWTLLINCSTCPRHHHQHLRALLINFSTCTSHYHIYKPCSWTWWRAESGSPPAPDIITNIYEHCSWTWWRVEFGSPHAPDITNSNEHRWWTWGAEFGSPPAPSSSKAMNTVDEHDEELNLVLQLPQTLSQHLRTLLMNMMNSGIWFSTCPGHHQY